MLATIPPPPFSGLELGPLDIRLYGVLIALGALAALRLTIRRYAAFGGDPALAERAGLLAVLAGVVGARLGFVLPRLDRYLERPQDIFWEGGLRGLAFFGGVTLATAAVIWYVHRRGGSIPAMADAVAPATPLAQAVGRWGNYFNQELYGRPTDLPWALEVELPFRRPGFEADATFHPTFLYESLWNLGLVGVLLLIGRRGRLRRGSLFFVYLIGYGVGRGWIETLRIDTVERYFGLSRNNWVAIAVVLVGVVGLWLWQRRGPDEEMVGEPDDDAEAGAESDDVVTPADGGDGGPSVREQPEAADDTDQPSAEPRAADPASGPDAIIDDTGTRRD